jgi:hypothetical protein
MLPDGRSEGGVGFQVAEVGAFHLRVDQPFVGIKNFAGNHIVEHAQSESLLGFEKPLEILATILANLSRNSFLWQPRVICQTESRM